MRQKPRSPHRDAARVPSKAARPLPSPGARSGGLGDRSSATAAISGSAWCRPREYALLLEHEAADLLMMYPPVSPAAARAGGKSLIASWLSSGTHTAVSSPPCGGVAKPTESRRFVFTPSPGFRDERWHHHRAGMAQGRDQPIWSVANRVRLQPVRAPDPSPGQGPAPHSGVRQASASPRLTHAGSLANQAPQPG
jgi:hypothetical protein